MDLESIYIHDYKIHYDEDNAELRKAIDYLHRDLKQEESAVFFEMAKKKGEAQFMDKYKKHFIIRYERHTDFFELVIAGS